MKTTIPFQGFYNSAHDAALDDAEAQLFQNDNGDTHHRLREHFRSAVDYLKVHREYAKAYTENFAKHVGLKSLTINELASPREYNFTADRICCNISSAEVRKMRREVTEVGLEYVAARRHTSYDGFHSFYNCNTKTWGHVDTWDDNQVGTLLEAWVFERVGDIVESDLMERDSDKGSFDTWLCNACPKVVIGRLWKVWSYLRDRAERPKSTIHNKAGVDAVVQKEIQNAHL